MLLSKAKGNQLIRIEGDARVYHVRSVRSIQKTVPDRYGTMEISVGTSLTLTPVRIRGRALHVIGKPQRKRFYDDDEREERGLPEIPNPKITVIGKVEYQPVVRLMES